MKLIKRIIALFTPIELFLLLTSLTISTLILIPLLDKEETVTTKEVQLLWPTSKVYSIEGGAEVPVIDTSFFVKYEKSSQEDTNKIISLLNDFLIPYHKLFDRHHYYFASNPVNPSSPTEFEKEKLPLLINLNYINDHKGETLEIEKPLYDLLTFGKEKTLNTPHNAFNIFIGGVYDFWGIHDFKATVANDPLNDSTRKSELERLSSYIPRTQEDINDTLSLWTSENKYYVLFNEFNGSSGEDLSISVGAIAKGMMSDVITQVMKENGLTRGYINGGTSSFSFLSPIFNEEPISVKMSSINSSPYAYEFTRRESYQLSTSGIYEGLKFTYNDQEIIRSHIIDPKSGYPANNEHQTVNVTSNTLSGMELDYLSTTLIVLNQEQGLSLLSSSYLDSDLYFAMVGKDSQGYYVKHNTNYPGGENSEISVDAAYREIILDLL